MSVFDPKGRVWELFVLHIEFVFPPKACYLRSRGYSTLFGGVSKAKRPALEEKVPDVRAINANIVCVNKRTVASLNEPNLVFRVRSMPRFFVAGVSIGFAERVKRREGESTRRCSAAGGSRGRLGRRVP